MTTILSGDWITLHGVVVATGLIIYAVGSHTLNQRRHPSAAIAWLIALMLIPYLALPIYLMLSKRKHVKRSVIPRALMLNNYVGKQDNLSAVDEHLPAALGLPSLATFEHMSIHADGQQALSVLRAMIAQAKHSLDLSTFIFGRDALGNEIAQRLMARAKQGLKIRLLLDGVGIYMGGWPDIKALKQAGVKVELFVSPYKSALKGRMNLRNHRKLVVVDAQWLWCGGRNIAAPYFVGDPGASSHTKPWIDLSFDLRGALAAQAQQRFDLDWAFATGQKPVQRTQNENIEPASRDQHRGRMVPSGPDQSDDTIYTLLVSSCFTARHRILAVTPYFVPDPPLLMGLALAARRGVRVDLLLPRQSNHLLADIARLSAFRELAAAGANIWLSPHMVHAKAIVIDDTLALAGSANLDSRSLFLNYEIMVAFTDETVVRDFEAWIDLQRMDAKRYKPHPPRLPRELLEAMVRWVAFQL
jgi:cardiolipin synthase